jgi:hypothetical protein
MVIDINGDRKAFGNCHFIDNLVGLDLSLIDDDSWVALNKFLDQNEVHRYRLLLRRQLVIGLHARLQFEVLICRAWHELRQINRCGRRILAVPREENVVDESTSS